jgi:hypothetical protein
MREWRAWRRRRRRMRAWSPWNVAHGAWGHDSMTAWQCHPASTSHISSLSSSTTTTTTQQDYYSHATLSGPPCAQLREGFMERSTYSTTSIIMNTSFSPKSCASLRGGSTYWKGPLTSERST